MQKSKLMGSGLAGLATQNIGGTVASAQTATGSAQTDALPISTDIVEVTTTAASTGVILPAGTSPGDSFLIYNIGASTLSLYPATGESINAIAANGAYSITTAKVCLVTKVSATRFCAGLLA